MSRTNSFLPSTTDADISDSTRRFSLRSRKTSHSHATSSSNTPSSVSGGSSQSTNSQRKDKRSSLASFSSKFRRSRRITNEEVHVAQGQNVSSEDSFLGLPAEIVTAVLIHLDASTLLSLRLVSRASLDLLRHNNPHLLRYPSSTQRRYYADLPVQLYPPHLPAHAFSDRDTSFLLYLRRKALVRRQLSVLLTFIQTRVYMLKLTTDLQCPHFRPYRNGLASRLTTPLWLIMHFLNTIRNLTIYVHPTHSHLQINLSECPTCLSSLRRTLATYPLRDLVSMHNIFSLLIIHLQNATRAPPMVGPIERKLRGWGNGPPPDELLVRFIVLGGLDQLSKVDEMKGSYPQRLSVVKTYTDTVADAERVNSLVFGDIYSGRQDPVMLASTTPTHPSSTQQLNTKSLAADRLNAIKAAGASHYPPDTPLAKALDTPLDKLTPEILHSLPPLSFFAGPSSFLGRYIVQKDLVEDENALLSRGIYPWLQGVMRESFSPADPWAHAQQEASSYAFASPTDDSANAYLDGEEIGGSSTSTSAEHWWTETHDHTVSASASAAASGSGTGHNTVA